MTSKIIQSIDESIQTKKKLLSDEITLSLIEDAITLLVTAFRQDKKVLFCGNGGSAGDAQHLSAELSGRFKKERPALYAEALHVNTSYVTAVANDYSFDYVYARMLEAAGRNGDVLVALSTSGNSINVLNAITVAKEKGMSVIGLTGATGGKMIDKCDILLRVPSDNTARIQESHIMIGHILCEQIENSLFE